MSKIKKEEIFKLLYEKTNTGIALHEIIVDKKGNPIDFIFLDANSAYEKLTKLKLKDIKGKRGKEVLPNLEEKWIKLYGKVALTGESVSVTDHSEYLNKYWDVKAYCPAKNLFAVALSDVTERELAKKELMATKELSEKYLQMAGSIFVALDPNGDILVLNNKGLEILGYTADEIVGKNWFDTCIPKDINQEIKGVFKKVFSGEMEGVEHYENEVVTKSGKHRTISWYNTYIKNEKGETEYLLSSGIDVTEINWKNAEILANEKKYHEILDNANAVVFIKDKNGKYLYINKMFEELHNISNSKIQGLIDHDLFSKERADIYRKNDLTVIEKKESLIMEERVMFADGLHVMLSTKFPLYNEENKIYALCGIATDITEQKEATEELKTIWDVSPDLICVADINTASFIQVNPAFTKTLGFSEDELLGKSFLEFVHPDDIQPTIDIIEEKLKKNEVVINFTNRYLCKDGSYRYLDWVSRPIIEQGLTYAIARDVTENKIIENKLIENERLLNATGRMARIGGWELDVKTQKVTWSEETYRIHEVPIDQEPPLQDAINFFHPDARPILQNALKKAMEKGEPYDLELRFISAKGNELFTHTKCEPVIKDGKVVKLHGTFQDITKEKKYKIEIEERNEFIQTILDNLPIGVALNKIDEGTATYINKKFEEIYGWPEAELQDIAKFFKKVYPDKKYREELQNKVMDDINSGDASRMHWENLEITRKDESHGFINSVNIPLFEQNTMVSTVMDITKLKKYEKELQEYQENLEEMVEQRTRELKVKNEELQRFNQLFIDREIRIKELKDKIKKLENKLKIYIGG
ncbi:MAG: PAS domain S-box protein [Candidatus Cloacimonetes bacterium]|nr:PAS domain S-box protein [Candidatus Cloacimonadota bacterium]MCF7814384.1 PAS domain S-box protein [Candidatus Cloacimonadota bacterium]MCF7868536.1 PAS domain S-box protein [Candidatus Cloacimonadota bacterium]MCF7884044.1 PAS domain S-box protein [Candidatus Cloacimonadota bacterium]